MQELVKIEGELETLKAENPNAESEDLPKEFTLNPKTISNLQILEDVPFEVEEWEKEHMEN